MASYFVSFQHIAREWRCKFSADEGNNSLKELQAAFEKFNVELSAADGVASVQRIVCGGCHDFKVVTKMTAEDFKKWEQNNFAPEPQFLETIKKINGVTAVETQTYTLEEVKLNKKDLKKAQEKAAAAAAPKAEEKPAPEDPAKLLKKVVKEGGKRGVEIEGAADMGGLQFFCTSVDCPDGDVDLLIESVKAMNAKSDPSEEERKGGSGHIGKMVFSAGTERLAIVAYVPEEKQSELSCEEWLAKVIALHPGSQLLAKAKDICTAIIPANADKGVFPLKIREGLILEANNFLRGKGLFPDNDDDSDDDYVFGDDDFPSM